jgi:hypothetical protein
MILKIIYMGFRERLIGNAWYALSVIYSLAIFFESIEKYGEALTILVFVFAIMKIGHLFSAIAVAKESSERAMLVDTEPHRSHSL